jgi:hypothetical protein
MPSGHQKGVLSLYRAFLEGAKLKPEAQRLEFKKLIRAEFQLHKGLKDTNLIEYQLRLGRKQLEMFNSPNLHSFSKFGINQLH